MFPVTNSKIHLSGVFPLQRVPVSTETISIRPGAVKVFFKKNTHVYLRLVTASAAANTCVYTCCLWIYLLLLNRLLDYKRSVSDNTIFLTILKLFLNIHLSRYFYHFFSFCLRLALCLYLAVSLTLFHSVSLSLRLFHSPSSWHQPADWFKRFSRLCNPEPVFSLLIAITSHILKKLPQIFHSLPSLAVLILQCTLLGMLFSCTRYVSVIL